ncbi:MAG: M23 family metallopeptidase [Proteobacteria bacterium]|nr:M23 family metallopeptidase [Pseudomonadota bacterium]
MKASLILIPLVYILAISCQFFSFDSMTDKQEYKAIIVKDTVASTYRGDVCQLNKGLEFGFRDAIEEGGTHIEFFLTNPISSDCQLFGYLNLPGDSVEFLPSAKDRIFLNEDHLRKIYPNVHRYYDINSSSWRSGALAYLVDARKKLAAEDKRREKILGAIPGSKKDTNLNQPDEEEEAFFDEPETVHVVSDDTLPQTAGETDISGSEVVISPPSGLDEVTFFEQPEYVYETVKSPEPIKPPVTVQAPQPQPKLEESGPLPDDLVVTENPELNPLGVFDEERGVWVGGESIVENVPKPPEAPKRVKRRDRARPGGQSDSVPPSVDKIVTTKMSDYAGIQMIFPLAIRPIQSYTSGVRRFGAYRSGSRLHAGCDLYAHHLTPVYSVADGRLLDSYYFTQGTYAHVVDHGKFVIRYAELQRPTRYPRNVELGEMIGQIGDLSHNQNFMLHFEQYSGTVSGRHTPIRAAPPFNRRSDLVNPTQFLLDLEKNLVALMKK